MNIVKPTAIVTAAVIGFGAATAHAGGFAEPIMEPEVIVEETQAGTSGFILPLVFLAVIAAVIAFGGNGGGDAVVNGPTNGFN